MIDYIFWNITCSSFIWCDFFKNIVFWEGEFNCAVSFLGATFHDKLREISSSKFNGTADFSGVTFVKGVSFSHATFTKKAIFEGTKFEVNANFWHSIFSDKASFSGAIFGTKLFADFSETVLSDKGAKFVADFSETVFSDKVDFLGATFSDKAAFSGVRFTVIGASGNEGKLSSMYPAKFKDVLSVASDAWCKEYIQLLDYRVVWLSRFI
jgi:uncharacterized protein YjbI with pentapeptide repeats